MRLVWTTDPHLNHVSLSVWDDWIDAIGRHAPCGVLIGGDVSEGDDVVFQLRRISETLAQPIHFVLGNHDFYHSSIATTRQRVVEAAREHAGLFYLTDLDPIELSPGTYLLGEDGWGDATVGDFEGSTVKLNDFALIDDFNQSDPSGWKALLQQQGKESAERLRHKLAGLPAEAREVIVLTHVPPFREACWYEGHTTDDNWAPFFVCGQIGDVLKSAGKSRPDCRLTVLCGHTHNKGFASISDHLVVYTGAAQYGQPKIEGLIEVNDQSLVITLVGPADS